MESSDTVLAGVETAKSTWLSLLGAALVTFVIWRFALYAFDLIGLSLTPHMGKCRKQWEVFGKGHEFWNGFFRWDGGWYSQIARNGYSYHPGKPSSVAFYPLYPYLSRYLGVVLGGPFIAGLFISNVAAVGAIYYLRRLGGLLMNDAVGKLASLFLLIFPSSLFLTSFYTEGLFICVAIGAMFHYLRGQFLWSALFGFAATLTRSTGIVLVAAIALDLAWRLVRREERPSWRMLWLLLSPLGIGAFMLMLQVQVGDPLAFTKILEPWERRPALPWESLVDAFRGTDYGFAPDLGKTQRFIDALAAVGFLGIGVAMAVRRDRVVLWSFVILGVLVPLLTYNLASMNRYVLGLFPAFLFIARACQTRPTLERWLIFASSFFLAIYSLRFMQCGWAG